MLRKRDELKFPYLFSSIRLREKQGVLVFLSAETADVERHLIEKITGEFKGEYEIMLIPITSEDYAPFNTIKNLQEVFFNKIIIFYAFPYEDYASSPETFEGNIRNLVSSLNVSRDIIPEKKLKCILICPPQVEDRIALQASDFYHFKTYSASFIDDARFHKDISMFKKGDEGKRKRIEFLKKNLRQSEGEEEEAVIFSELGNIYYELSEIKNALTNWEKAKNIFDKVKDEKNSASVTGNIGLVYRDMGDLEQALKFHGSALEIDKKIGYLQGEANQLGNIGLVYSDMGDLEQALKFLKRSEKIFREMSIDTRANAIFEIIEKIKSNKME